MAQMVPIKLVCIKGFLGHPWAYVMLGSCWACVRESCLSWAIVRECWAYVGLASVSKTESYKSFWGTFCEVRRNVPT